jgi:GNAT superfamily N-acetyltransferase
MATPHATSAAIAGGWATFHAVDSPATQAIGIGMNGPVESADLDQLEAFFHDRGSPAVIDLCSLVDSSLIAMLYERGYVVKEITNVLVRSVAHADPTGFPTGIEVQPVAADEADLWVRMVLQGFAGGEDFPEEHASMLASAGPGLHTFFGLSNAVRGATAAMAVHNGLATFFGDATLVHARGQGLQMAVIRHRMQIAARLGCDLASASVVPGGVSHRNYERAGFHLVYARIMVSRPIRRHV